MQFYWFFDEFQMRVSAFLSSDKIFLTFHAANNAGLSLAQMIQQNGKILDV